MHAFVSATQPELHRVKLLVCIIGPSEGLSICVVCLTLKSIPVARGGKKTVVLSGLS